MDVPAVSEAPVAPAAGVPPFARLPVLGVAAAVGAVLLAVSGKFGYFGDELYFLASARHHLAWGYADNPWLLPVLARLPDTVLPGSVVGLRVLPMLLTAAGVVLAALIAREFGGGARAQVMTAAAYALSFQLLASGHVLATSTVDPFCWVLVSWLVARWVRTRSDRLLLYAGLVTAIAMQGKFLIVFLWLGLVAGALIAGPRTLPRRPALWAGGVVTVLLTVPTLVWQARHGWPYLLMNAVVAEQNDRLLGGTVSMVPLAVLMAGLLVGAFLCCHGFAQLLRAPELRDFRLFGWAAALVTVLFLATASRYYYVAGLYAVLFAASAVRLERRRAARWWRWVPTWPVYVLSVPLAVYLALPVRPATGFTGVQLVDFVGSGSYGWPRLADTAAESFRRLPPDDRAHTVVMGDSYWQASALAVYGPDRGLPAAYGPERGYWYAGAPPDDTRQVLYVGGDRESLGHFFGQVRQVNTVRLDIDAHVANQGVAVWLCGAPRDPWPRLWGRMHRP
ncbi:ArnT family glycosyltransferase [Amycolatopsis sp. NPDC059027]|uniref:ArnT family glycosyltransferase n=1 Tax=Amycolatopsis sp. NPDC059027 TaxID=3346709 RepID=UPI00366C8D56